MDLKLNLRKKIIAERKLLSGYEFQYENEAILENVSLVLKGLDKQVNTQPVKIVKLQTADIEFINPNKNIGLYLPFRGEPDLIKLILYHPDWGFSLPKLEVAKMEFVDYKIGAPLKNVSISSVASDQAATASKNRSTISGLMEPLSNIKISPHIIIAPGLAYSVKGYRLGFGAGYYDKYLATKKEAKIIAIGVCFDKYLLEDVPCQEHDVKFDYVITDKIILKL